MSLRSEDGNLLNLNDGDGSYKCLLYKKTSRIPNLSSKYEKCVVTVDIRKSEHGGSFRKKLEDEKKGLEIVGPPSTTSSRTDTIVGKTQAPSVLKTWTCDRM